MIPIATNTEHPLPPWGICIDQENCSMVSKKRAATNLSVCPQITDPEITQGFAAFGVFKDLRPFLPLLGCGARLWEEAGAVIHANTVPTHQKYVYPYCIRIPRRVATLDFQREGRNRHRLSQQLHALVHP